MPEKTIERITDGAPKEIVELFKYPYEYFTDMFGDKTKSVLDAGCGEAPNYSILKKGFKEVYLLDKECKTNHRPFIHADIEKLFGKESVLGKQSMDIVFCFETLEHLDHPISAIENLGKIAKDYLVIGSVNKEGPDFYKGVEIFKAKNGKNPFHLNEMNILDFLYYIKSAKIRGKRAVQFFSSFEENGKLRMRNQLSHDSLVNYVVIQKR